MQVKSAQRTTVREPFERRSKQESSIGFSILLGFLLFGCTTPCPEKKNQDLIPTHFSKLPGWHEDEQAHALPALHHTCNVISKKEETSPMITKSHGGGKASDWKPFCQKLAEEKQSDGLQTSSEIREFMESHLQPYQIALGGETEGTFTGYYVPILRGSLNKHGPYQTPLYQMPQKGKTHKVSRNKIVNGALNGKGLELVWVDDPIEAFFVQIQGSGFVQLEDGREMKIGYAGQNGFPYFPIGKALLDRGALEPGNVNMHTIKKWLKDHPEEAEQIMSLNQSYVFFKEISGPGPIGAHGVPLTPHRSMAVDRNYISLGTPLWLVADHPDSTKPLIQQLLIAQDVGGAIKGAVRGDYFWGIGDEAGHHAGKMNSTGSLYVLLPRHTQED